MLRTGGQRNSCLDRASAFFFALNISSSLAFMCSLLLPSFKKRSEKNHPRSSWFVQNGSENGSQVRLKFEANLKKVLECRWDPQGGYCSIQEQLSNLRFKYCETMCLLTVAYNMYVAYENGSWSDLNKHISRFYQQLKRIYTHTISNFEKNQHTRKKWLQRC